MTTYVHVWQEADGLHEANAQHEQAEDGFGCTAHRAAPDHGAHEDPLQNVEQKETPFGLLEGEVHEPQAAEDLAHLLEGVEGA